MSVTAIVFVLVYALGLVLAFVRNPLYGLCAYIWAFYNHPPSRWWGSELPELRWSLIAAAVTLTAAVLRRSQNVAPPAPAPYAVPNAGPMSHTAGTFSPVNWGGRLLTLFAAWTWIQTPWAVNTQYHLDGCILFTKYVILYYTITALVDSQERLELFSWLHVLGCFLWGWIAYGPVTLQRGRLELELGPSVDDSNVLGFHLVTGLAFAGLMFFCIPKVRRWLALGAIPLIMNAVVLTASRTALVAMGAAGAVVLLAAPRRGRWLLRGGAVLGLVLLMMLAKTDIFWERAATMTVTDESEMEGSAESRFAVGRANLAMFADYPLGVGNRGNEVISRRYVPARNLSPDTGLRGAHTTILAVLVDEGAPGVIIYVAMWVWAVSRLVRLKLLDRRGLPSSLGLYRAAVAGGLAACLAAGLTVNLLKAEVSIWLFALVAVVDRLAFAWLRQHEPAVGTTRAAVQPSPLAAGVRPSTVRVAPRLT